MSSDLLYMSNDSLYMVKTKTHGSAMLFPEVLQMDLIQIGKFIAELRKAQGLTQEQFGEKVGVTNKTVSRWETGTYLPPADALLSMSRMFDVTVNEILSGKRLTAEEYRQAAEENLTQAIRVSSFSLKDRIGMILKNFFIGYVGYVMTYVENSAYDGSKA